MELAPETQDAQVYLANTAMAAAVQRSNCGPAPLDRTRGWLKDLNQSGCGISSPTACGAIRHRARGWRQKWETSTKTYSLCMTGLQHLAVMGRERAADALLVECASLRTPHLGGSSGP